MILREAVNPVKLFSAFHQIITGPATMGSEFGIKEEGDKMRLTPGAPSGGAGRWMLAGWVSLPPHE